MLAISHAIEDIAAEERQGELIATFQDFKNFLPHKNRYMGLAEDLDAVRVWGCGKSRKNAARSISSRPTNAAAPLLARPFRQRTRPRRPALQAGQPAVKFEDKKFIGFYSFNPYLVQSIRWRFNLLSCGLSRVMAHWEKSFPFPDLKMRDLDRLIGSPMPLMFRHLRLRSG
jgi:hypothetical protein